MVNVFDVAKYILHKQGTMTTMKLQKLVYYSQAWYLVWEEKPLFNEKIEAWSNGPVVPKLYNIHKGLFQISAKNITDGNIHNLTALQKKNIDIVLKYYGNKTSQWLSDLTHKEKPWKEAREGLEIDERGHEEITPVAMAEYYESL